MSEALRSLKRRAGRGSVGENGSTMIRTTGGEKQACFVPSPGSRCAAGKRGGVTS